MGGSIETVRDGTCGDVLGTLPNQSTLKAAHHAWSVKFTPHLFSNSLMRSCV